MSGSLKWAVFPRHSYILNFVMLNLSYGHQAPLNQLDGTQPVFYSGKRSSGNIDYSCFKEGDHFAFRFELKNRLGTGCFGGVVRAVDHKEKKEVAVKLVRRDDSRGYWVNREVDILLELARLKDLKKNIKYVGLLELLECVDYRGYTCVVMNLLGTNLEKLIKQNGYVGFHCLSIRTLLPSLFSGLAYLHECGFVHLDLKPGNIVLKNADSWLDGVNIIDLNLSCTVEQLEMRRKIVENRRLEVPFIASDYGPNARDATEFNDLGWSLQPTEYAAPEAILLCRPLTYAIDVWAVGCIIAELALGSPIFPKSGPQMDALYSIIETFGPLPRSILSRCIPKISRSYLTADGLLKAGGALSYIPLCGGKPALGSRTLEKALSKSTVDTKFVNFLSDILKFDPDIRPSAVSLLNHDWIRYPST